MDDDDSPIEDATSMWTGFLSMFTGFIGVMFVMGSILREPKSMLGLIMGILIFVLAFALRFVHLIYRRPIL